MSGSSEKVWDILPEICSSALWHENIIGGLRNLFMYLRWVMNTFPIMEHFKLPLPTIFVTTPLPNRISSMFYIQNKGRSEGVLLQQLCGMCSCFSIRYCVDNNYMYHMTKCSLLLVIDRSQIHNIDVSLCITKVLM